MISYAKSRDLHRTLRNRWDPTFKPLGYKRCKGSLASYYRPRLDEKGFLRFWAQASQWGDSWSGNSFTLNVDISIRDPNLPFAGSDRFLGNLSKASLNAAEKISERIILRKPKPPKEHWIYEEIENGDNKEFWRKAFDREFNYEPGKFKSKTDIWLPYFSTEDVVEWADFLAPLLPNLLEHQERSGLVFGRIAVTDEAGNVDYKRTLNE